jgi:hypothetical protein
VTTEKTQEKDQKKSHQQKPQVMVYQPKKVDVPGTRTNEEEKQRKESGTGESRTHGTTNSQQRK